MVRKNQENTLYAFDQMKQENVGSHFLHDANLPIQTQQPSTSSASKGKVQLPIHFVHSGRWGKNPHFENHSFHKIYLYEISIFSKFTCLKSIFFTKFAFLKSQFSQNSHFWNVKTTPYHANFWIKSGVLPKCARWRFAKTNILLAL